MPARGRREGERADDAVVVSVPSQETETLQLAQPLEAARALRATVRLTLSAVALDRVDER